MIIDHQILKAAQQITDRIPPGFHPIGFEPITSIALQDVIHRIVVGLNPEKIILFGSYAYGNPTPDSDLDLLVIMETHERPVERTLAVSRLLRPRPFPIDILVRTSEEIIQAQNQGDDFFREILEKGKVIYARPD
jgi:uncharacterized protein